MVSIVDPPPPHSHMKSLKLMRLDLLGMSTSNLEQSNSHKQNTMKSKEFTLFQLLYHPVEALLVLHKPRKITQNHNPVWESSEQQKCYILHTTYTPTVEIHPPHFFSRRLKRGSIFFVETKGHFFLLVVCEPTKEGQDQHPRAKCRPQKILQEDVPG